MPEVSSQTSPLGPDARGDGSGRSGRSAPEAEGRRARRRRELHQLLLATAAELFARDGYDATTVERIAEAADVVPATFFNHFPSKEDVLREIGAGVFARFHALVSEQASRPAATAERLRAFAERGATLVRRAPDMTRRVLVAVLRSNRPGQSGAELAAMEAGIAALLENGREAGDVPVDLDTSLAAEILVSVVIGSVTHWINDPSYPLERRLPAAVTLAAGGLLRAADLHETIATNPPPRRRPTAKPPGHEAPRKKTQVRKSQ